MAIEHNFDIAFVADLALREKQIQQNYRPIIAVHKWFARRPGTLFRSLLLAEFADVPLREAFYQGHSFKNVSVLDPFILKNAARAPGTSPIRLVFRAK